MSVSHQSGLDLLMAVPQLFVLLMYGYAGMAYNLTSAGASLELATKS